MTTATLAAVTFHRATLASALSALAPLAKNRRIPVLSCIRLTAEDGTATLEATDLDTRAQIRITCDGEGSAILPADLFSNLISRLSSDSVALEIEGTRVTVRAGRSVTKLTSVPDSDWPLAPGEVEGATYTLPGDVLRRLAGVGFVASTEITRPILNGVYFHARDGKLAAVGTDGHRLLLRESGTDGDLNAIIHEGGLSYALKLMEQALEIQVRTNGNYLEFSAEFVSVLVRTIEGPYPNYDQIIPRDQDKTAAVDRKEMIAALRRVELIARQGANDKKPPRVICTFDEQGLTLSASSDSEIEDAVLLESYAGEPITIGFNAGYLLDILGQITAPTVEIQMKHPDRAVTITGGEDEGLFLCMPLRIRD